MAKLKAKIVTRNLSAAIAMMRSLAEALDKLNYSGSLDDFGIKVDKNGIMVLGRRVVDFTWEVLKPQDKAGSIVVLRAPAKPVLALFAVEICDKVPGLKVRWPGPWPEFWAFGSDDDEGSELDPDCPPGQQLELVS